MNGRSFPFLKCFGCWYDWISPFAGNLLYAKPSPLKALIYVYNKQKFSENSLRPFFNAMIYIVIFCYVTLTWKQCLPKPGRLKIFGIYIEKFQIRLCIWNLRKIGVWNIQKICPTVKQNLRGHNISRTDLTFISNIETHASFLL